LADDVALASATEKSKPKFVVRDHSGQALAYVYFEDEPGRRSAAKLLSNEARRALIEIGTQRQLVVSTEQDFIKRRWEGGSCSSTTEQDVMRFALLLGAAVILIRDPTGKWASDPLQPWFQSSQSKDGLYCCASARMGHQGQ